MIMRTEVWLTTLVVDAVIAFAFLYVIAKFGKPYDSTRVQKKASAIRPWWFLALVVGLGVL
jgi:hypothetical protein